jgi:hypothetical protein
MSYDTTVHDALDPPLARVESAPPENASPRSWRQRIFQRRRLIICIIVTAIMASGAFVGFTIGVARAKQQLRPNPASR